MPRLLFACLVWSAGFCLGAELPKSVNYYRDVAPILQKHCESCHRPGEIGPMALTSYEQVRPWAKAIKAAVATRKMPPWGAEPGVGQFQNDPSLSSAELNTIVSWVDSGSKAGNKTDAPTPVAYTEGWNIGKPDLVVTLPKPFKIPAKGTVDYTYVVIPTGFTEDKWVQAVEYRPDHRAMTHHAAVFLRTPGSKWLRQYPEGDFFVPAEGIRQPKSFSRALSTVAGAGPREPIIIPYTPGRSYAAFAPDEAFKIPAGSDFVVQLHYTPNGKELEDRPKFGLIFAQEPPKKILRALIAGNAVFKIPPGDPNYEVKASITFPWDCELIALNPHMHLRGKSMQFRIITPDGQEQTLLNVPKYDFNWQLDYRLQERLKIQKGTRFEVIAHYDNSPNNPFNPDPTAEVQWGDQTWEEMMVGGAAVAVPASAGPRP